jgi:hypothetical protein
VSANPNRGTSGESLRIPDPADYREVHRGSLLGYFTRLVKCRRNQTAVDAFLQQGSAALARLRAFG